MKQMLLELYPTHGVEKTAELMGLTAPQVRMKAHRMKIKSPMSEARIKANQEHSERMIGRKCPQTSETLKRKYASGEITAKPISDERKKQISERTKKHISECGHPKGMLGKKHSEQFKKDQSVRSKKNYQAMTEEKKQGIILKMMKTKEANGTAVPTRIKQTWKASWREIGGKRKYFRSRWEANFARLLEYRKLNGEILDWLHEPKTFWFDGVKRGTVSYLPDFLVTNTDGSELFFEVKGWMDDRSKTKLKRMAKYYPDVKLILVDSKEYKILEKEFSSVIDGWEK